MLSGPYLFYKGLYWYSLRHLPEARQPVRDDTLPEHLLELAWKEFRGTGPRQMVPIRFDHFAGIFVQAHRDGTLTTRPPGSEAFYRAAAILLARNQRRFKPLEWQIVWASTAIWLSHNWTIDETLSTLLNSSYYEHGMSGISQSSRGYFAKAPDELSLEESAVLLVIPFSPGGLNPWCRPEENLRRVNQLFMRISRPALLKLPETLLSAPDGACVQ